VAPRMATENTGFIVIVPVALRAVDVAKAAIPERRAAYTFLK